ncbi:hypothetical protein B0H11DRAFT_1914526 [Mycena galericulata]|nr:hypothetical protein B0H11DRAFT_1914526 [Mycena galericulata]
MLTDCAKLEVLVLLWLYTSSSKAFEWMGKSPFRDVRLVGVLYKDYWEDWENGARGHGNFWSAANTFVALKRRALVFINRFINRFRSHFWHSLQPDPTSLRGSAWHQLLQPGYLTVGPK